MAIAKTVTIMEMTEDAKQAYDTFEKEIEDRIETENLDIKEGYCGQLPNLVVRLSCLYRISRMSIDEVKNYGTTAQVEKQDVERAITYASKAWNWFEKVVDMMKSGENKKLLKAEQAKTVILELLSDGEIYHWKKIIKFVDEVAGIKQANVFAALKQLEKDNLIEKTKAGYYRIKPKKDVTQNQGG